MLHTHDIKYSLKKKIIRVVLPTFFLYFSCTSFYSEIRYTSFLSSIISSRDKILRLLATRRSRNSLSRASKILLDDRAKAVYSRAFWNLLRPGNSEFTAGNSRSAELALSSSEHLHFTCTIRSQRIFCTLPLILTRCLLHDHHLVLYPPLCSPLEHNHHPLLRRLRRARKHSRAFGKRIIFSLSDPDDVGENYFLHTSGFNRRRVVILNKKYHMYQQEKVDRYVF